ncbi:hypothetical protein C7I87_23530 [Mesorhizobium sp. SARCC-RB16n]|uniref:ATP-grasp domain-containing protein n=1 Tax=Mesorhizobium sp. SARCC-RB16n TaxID=2116687 RepID=UPI00122F43BE|nr:acetyl-CoA carboxylase biotin carboxylase subunit family protein [Mesorhizobium sp. SARCC-RB16n]KAA3448104.1 hypothetical protein C7I87_23530 [Mesorhizobium sp. SARCC-RB16n]
MTKRRAFILIEGHRSGPLYAQAAQRLGLYPITLSSDPSRHGYIAAEGLHAICIDTSNLDALIHECSQLHAIHGIAGITGGLDSVYLTVAKLCRHFGLPGPAPFPIEQCYDKFSQRQLLAQAGIPVPAHRIATSAADIESSAAEIGLPVILKPAAGSGSWGVRLCRNVDELAEHTNHLLEGGHLWRSPPRVLVEEFAQGPQYYSDIMGNEVIEICAIDFGPLPHFVVRQVICPALLTTDQHKKISDLSLDCLRAIGLGWGPANIEFRWTKRGPVVIEVNPRLSGVPDPQLIHLACGVDLITEHTKLAIGHEWNLRKTRSQTAAARMLVADRDGVLNWIHGVANATELPGIKEVKIFVTPNTVIVRKGDDRDFMGYVIAASPNPAQSEEILRRAVELIAWSITPDSIA